MKFIVWKDQIYSPIRDGVEETDGNVFFHDVNGEKCVADRADLLYIAPSEQDANRFLGIESGNSFCVQKVTYENICANIGGMKLSVYARQMGISYRTAFRWFKSGKIRGDGHQHDSHDRTDRLPTQAGTRPGSRHLYSRFGGEKQGQPRKRRP